MTKLSDEQLAEARKKHSIRGTTDDISDKDWLDWLDTIVDLKRQLRERDALETRQIEERVRAGVQEKVAAKLRNLASALKKVCPELVPQIIAAANPEEEFIRFLQEGKRASAPDDIETKLQSALDAGFEHHDGFPDGTHYHDGCTTCQTHKELSTWLANPILQGKRRSLDLLGWNVENEVRSQAAFTGSTLMGPDASPSGPTIP